MSKREGLKLCDKMWLSVRIFYTKTFRMLKQREAKVRKLKICGTQGCNRIPTFFYNNIKIYEMRNVKQEITK